MVSAGFLLWCLCVSVLALGGALGAVCLWFVFICASVTSFCMSLLVVSIWRARADRCHLGSADRTAACRGFRHPLPAHSPTPSPAPPQVLTIAWFTRTLLVGQVTKTNAAELESTLAVEPLAFKPLKPFALAPTLGDDGGLCPSSGHMGGDRPRRRRWTQTWWSQLAKSVTTCMGCLKARCRSSWAVGGAS